jgi:hypothetical protein
MIIGKTGWIAAIPFGSQRVGVSPINCCRFPVAWLPTTKQLALVIYAANLLTLNSAADGQPRRGACGYENSAGNLVPRPCKSTNKPGASASGATALCGDGTYSYSQRLDETCSHHGGAVLFLP